MEEHKMSSARRRRKRQLARRGMLAAVCLIGGGVLLTSAVSENGNVWSDFGNLLGISENIDSEIGMPTIQSELLDVNEYSRPGTRLRKVRGVVLHYVGNPNTTAIANRNYFNSLKDLHTTKASSHFVVGLEGEIIQCVPVSEISYASNDRNSDTIAIECCHPDATGKFNQKTYDSMVDLTGWLCFRYGLTKEDVIRHYDVTGKNCPKYFVEHEEAWIQFLSDVEKRIREIEGLAE